MRVPEELSYTTDHEWVSTQGTRARIGITDYAQDALGDVVFVGLPEVGRSVAAGDVLGEIESTKSVSEVYAPVAGTVAAVNDALPDAPERLNQDPYGEGWLCEIELTGGSGDALLDAEGYRRLTSS